MNEVLKYLDDQPQLWPRWKRGFRYDPNVPLPGLVATEEKHLYIFVRRYGQFAQGQYGVIYPACHFVDGEQRIFYDDERRLTSTDEDPLCGTCFEVELQHALSE